MVLKVELCFDNLSKQKSHFNNSYQECDGWSSFEFEQVSNITMVDDARQKVKDYMSAKDAVLQCCKLADDDP